MLQKTQGLRPEDDAEVNDILRKRFLYFPQYSQALVPMFDIFVTKMEFQRRRNAVNPKMPRSIETFRQGTPKA